MLGEVSYQRYDFGYLNADDNTFVSTGLTTEEVFAGYLSLRDNGEYHDAKIVLLANETLMDFASATVTIAFDEKVFTFTLGGANNEFEMFRAGIAGGEPYFAGEGCALFGAVVTDIPDGAWETLTVTITVGEEALFTGSTTYAE